MSLTITGASDDLVEVDGDVCEEFTYRDDEDGGGTLVAGPEDGPDPAIEYRRTKTDDGHHDAVTVNLAVAWVVCGHRIEQAR